MKIFLCNSPDILPINQSIVVDFFGFPAISFFFLSFLFLVKKNII